MIQLKPLSTLLYVVTVLLVVVVATGPRPRGITAARPANTLRNDTLVALIDRRSQKSRHTLEYAAYA